MKPSLPWRADLKDRAGPMWSPAQVAATALEWESSVPQGADALGGIRAALVDYVDQDDPGEERDRQWVEAYGALFGLVLLDALGGPGHAEIEGRHMIRLGRWGSFDPFAPMDEALHSDEPATAFLEAVRLAESEANGSGPMSGVVSAFAGALESKRPDLSIEDYRGLHLTLSSGVEINLQQVARATDGLPESALRAACEKMLRMLPGSEGAEQGMTWEEACPRLMPRLVGDGFIGQLGESARESLFRIALREDLHLMLLLEYPERSRFVRGDEMRAWGKAESEIILRAINNLGERSDKAAARWEPDQSKPLLLFQSRDGWDASRLILPGLYDVAATELTPPFAVAIPHRDELALCEWDDSAAVERLRAHAADAFARAPHGISPAVYRLDAAGLMAAVIKPASHE